MAALLHGCPGQRDTPSRSVTASRVRPLLALVFAHEIAEHAEHAEDILPL